MTAVMRSYGPGRAARRSLLIRPDEAHPDVVTDQARQVVDAQPVHQPGPMRLDRLGADPQPAGDSLRRLALGDPAEDLAPGLRGVRGPG